ncbi:hypothetical protein GJAV_G00234660 [Gymnothorax javanicus]|nr:hypothetical protein GJAV_G00234660 [Gymnothorax javanicus]
MLTENGDCVVKNFTVGRKGYGSIFFPGAVNLANLNLDEIVHFRRKEVIVYPDDNAKPPVGEGLNRRAEVTLDGVWPKDKTTCTQIKSPERLADMNYEGRLQSACRKHGAQFLDYRPETGSWVFRVPHFSKYGLQDSDEEEEVSPPIKWHSTEKLHRRDGKACGKHAARCSRPPAGGGHFLCSPSHIPLHYLAPPISRRPVPEDDALEELRSITQSYLHELVVAQ